MSNKEITNEEILDLIDNRGLSIEQVIDVIIEDNALIGVGLISLKKYINDYITYKIT